MTTKVYSRHGVGGAWLRQEPSLAEVQRRYPGEFAVVQRELHEAIAAGGFGGVSGYLEKLHAPGRQAHPAAELRRYIAVASARQLSLAAATGVTEGKVRFGQRDGRIAQKLLFERNLVRKPVSMRAFRALWPLVRDKRYLMPLVEPQGIYCFYSQELVDEIAALVGDRACLEIAAGDGTLSRFLGDRGVTITATDDHSWSGRVTYDERVVKEDARTALRTRAPQAVVCSWPPAGNPFEAEVFRTASVDLYVLIASRHRFASGDWDAYEAQRAFDMAEAPELSRLVLPPELECAVYVFRRQV